VNPEFWHFSRKEKQEIELRKLHSNVPVLLPALPQSFRRISRIASNLTFVKLLFVSLFSAVGAEGDDQLVDEIMIDLALRLFEISLDLEGVNEFIDLVCNRPFVVPGTRRDRRTFLVLLFDLMSRENASIRFFLPRMEMIISRLEAGNVKAAGLISDWRIESPPTSAVISEPAVISDGKKRKMKHMKRFAKQQAKFSEMNFMDEDSSMHEASDSVISLPHGNCVFCQDVADSTSPVYGMMGYIRSSASGLVGPGSSSICSTPCGHLLHNGCFREFMDSLFQERNRMDDGSAGNFSMFVGYVSDFIS
jgi:hypothetical protein